MAKLKGKTVLVTGGGQGIGRTLATALSAAGANVVVADIDGDALKDTESQIRAAGGHILCKTMDITQASSVEQLKHDAERQFGRVDVLVNNAAVGAERISPRYLTEKPKFWEVSDDVWVAMLRVNVFGAQLMSRVFVRGMLERKWGRIINITTSLDTMYRSGVGGYGPCKAALEAASRIMATDLKGTGVTANVVVPGGPVNTRMVPADSGIPAEKLIQPEKMSDPVIWLCSGEADQINGIRIIAVKWDTAAPVKRRLADASAPVAWPQLGPQSTIADTDAQVSP